MRFLLLALIGVFVRLASPMSPPFIRPPRPPIRPSIRPPIRPPIDPIFPPIFPPIIPPIRPTPKPPITLAPGTSPSYIIYTPSNYIPGPDFFINIIVYGAKESTINYTIFVDGVKIINSASPSSNQQIFLIKPKYLKKRRTQIVRIRARIWEQILFDEFKFIYYRGGALPQDESLFIQLDKPYYKPNDRVRFRTFGLNHTLKVSKEPLDIKVIGPNKNLMKIWHNLTNETGVISKEFQLSDKPVLGSWKIKLLQHNTGLKMVQRFNVEKYVLPRTKVTLKGDQYIYHLGFPAFFLAKESIHLYVKARYSYGGAVKGRVYLRISIIGDRDISVEKIFKLRGQLSYRFRMSEFFYTRTKKIIILNPFMPHYIRIKVVAKVVEDETDLITVTPPMYVNIVTAPIRIEAPYMVSFKPKLCNEFTVEIKRVDGNPLTLVDVKVKLNVTFINEEKIYSILLCIPLDGKVKIDIPRVIYKSIKIYYCGISGVYGYSIIKRIFLRQFRSPVPYFVTAKLGQPISYAGDTIRIYIESTAILKKVYYLIVRESQHIAHGHFYAYGLYVNLHIKSKPSWIPGVCIVFTSITAGDDLLVDVLPVKLKVDFAYQVTGIFSPRQRTAGKPVTLSMGAAANATVFIVTVDERLDFLKKNKYISSESINREFVGSSSLTRPVYLNDFTSLLNFCRLNWKSNVIGNPTFAYRGVPRMMASQSINRVSVVSKVKMRDEFPEVWIWANEKTNSEGRLSISLKTPDTITNWKTHAFAIHPTEGISVLEEKPQFLSFQQMFLSLDLPYSVIQNEGLILNVIVYNYFKTAQQVEVFFKEPNRMRPKLSGLPTRRTPGRKNGKKYRKKNNGKKREKRINRGGFGNITANVNGEKSSDKGRRIKKWISQVAFVDAKDYKSIKFKIRPERVGKIPLVFKLYSAGIHYDSLKKKLEVEPEGRTLYFHKEREINMTKGTASEIIHIRMPKMSVVPDSKRIEVCAIGDVMGPAIDNIGNLVRLPRGCGEQTALTFVPNIYIYLYLVSRKSKEKELLDKIIKYTESGYQNQLAYQREDGSYSAFLSDKQGSVWLTAFVVMGFNGVIESNMGVYIDRKKLKKSVKWLTKQQQRDGRFEETGRVIHRSMQGGVTGSIALTAYVLDVLRSLKDIARRKVEKATKKAGKYLRTVDEKNLDVYTLCILFYTYARSNGNKRFKKIEKLLAASASPGPLTHWPGDYAVEQTGYVLLAYLSRFDIESSRPIFAWILSQSTDLGGFSSTQDTVVALHAMSMFATFIKRTTNATITIKTAEGFMYTFDTITIDNIYLVQKKKVPSDSHAVAVTAVGNGIAYIKVYWQYNVYRGSNDNFGLSINADTVLDRREKNLRLTICYGWNKTTEPEMLTCMVKLPSGFRADGVRCTQRTCNRAYLTCETIDGCLDNYEVERNRVVLYLNNLTYSNNFCTEVSASKMYAVMNRELKIEIECVSYYSLQRVTLIHNALRREFDFDTGAIPRPN